MTKLAIIGAGSMCEALISGIVSSKMITKEKITVTNRGNIQRLEELSKNYGIKHSLNIQEMVNDADVIILAMKPKNVKEAILQWKDFLNEDTLIISVLAGVGMKSIELLIEKKVPIARAMPNTSATVGKSATGIALNTAVSDSQKAFVIEMFETVGFATILEEEQLDAVTGLSGSGPAYIYYLVEAMEKGATEIGLDRKIANELIVQTLMGAAEMIANSSKSPAELRKNVTSPGGTTEAGIKVLDSYNVQTAFIQCIKEATTQSVKMGRMLSDDLKLTK